VNANRDIAARIDGRLERLGLSADEADRQAGLPPNTVSAILDCSGQLPRGNALRRLAVVLDVDEAFILGLEPGDLIPPHMLQEAQGDLGLLAPDEEALLRNYRRLDVPTRAAVLQLVTRAAGPEAAPQPAGQAGRRRHGQRP